MASSEKDVLPWGHKWRALARSALVQIVGLVGFGICVEGIREIYQPAAMIVAGSSMVVWTILKVRRTT